VNGFIHPDCELGNNEKHILLDFCTYKMLLFSAAECFVLFAEGAAEVKGKSSAVKKKRHVCGGIGPTKSFARAFALFYHLDQISFSFPTAEAYKTGNRDLLRWTIVSDILQKVELPNHINKGPFFLFKLTWAFGEEA